MHLPARCRSELGRTPIAAIIATRGSIPPVVSLEGMNRIRLAIKAFNRRDVDAMLRWNHPDVVYQTAIASMEGGGGVYHGHEGVRQWTQDLDEAVEDLRGELDELYDVGGGRYLGAGVSTVAVGRAVLSSMCRWPGST